MTEKRYSDGTLARWYYSQTNVISDGDNEYYLRNKESIKDLDYNELLGTNDLLDELNKLSDENEQLKHDATVLIHANQDYRRENEQLKFENKNLKVAIQARDAKIEVCEKKFRELGYIITVDDDGYVIE